MHDWIVPPKYSQHLNFAPFVQATSDVSRKQFMVSMNCCSVLLPVLFGGRGGGTLHLAQQLTKKADITMQSKCRYFFFVFVVSYSVTIILQIQHAQKPKEDNRRVTWIWVQITVKWQSVAFKFILDSSSVHNGKCRVYRNIQKQR